MGETTKEGVMGNEPYRVFWQPGCSACVRVKEFLTELGVPFESVNLLENDDALADLQALGARSIPVVSRGSKFVFGQSLTQVAEFIGKTPQPRQPLSSEELMKRWVHFLEVGRSHMAQIPDEFTTYHPVPGRDRTLLGLAYHIFQIPDSFLQLVQDGVEDWVYVANLPVPDAVQVPADALPYADLMSGRIEDWWRALDDKSCKWPVKTFYGLQSAHELLERQTWHSAQHARQLEAVLSEFGVEFSRRIDAQAYDGLPMPVGLWA